MALYDHNQNVTSGFFRLRQKSKLRKKKLSINNFAGILFSFEYFQYQKQLAKSATFMMILDTKIMIFHLLW